MPTRIVIPERIIKSIGVSIEGKWIARPRHNSIGLDKAAQLCVVESRVVKVQSNLGFETLAGAQVVRGGGAGAGAGLAKGGILCLALESAVRVGSDAGGAKACAERSRSIIRPVGIP